MERIGSQNKVLGVFGAVVLLLLIGLGSFTYGKVRNGTEALPTPTVTSEPTIEPTITPEPTPTVRPGKSSKTPTRTPTPSLTPTITLTPTVTPVPFMVTNLSVVADPVEFSGSCGDGKKITFTAHITTNDKGTVTYKWKRSDGGITSTPQSVNFDKSGTQSVSTSWTLPDTLENGWEQIEIISPNSSTSEQVIFSLNCT